MRAAHEEEQDHQHDDGREREQHVQLGVTVVELRLREEHARRLGRAGDHFGLAGYMFGIDPVTSVVGAGEGLPSLVTSTTAIIPPSSWARMWQWNT